jgi:hypothetical protein
MRFAHLKTHYRFERMRLRDLSGAHDEFLLAAIERCRGTLKTQQQKPARLSKPPPETVHYALQAYFSFRWQPATVANLCGVPGMKRMTCGTVWAIFPSLS